MSERQVSERAAIMRRAVWLAAALAALYAGFTAWTWRPIELLISIGCIALCAVADIGLRYEQRAHLGASPFGPVQKWGLRR